PHRGIGPGPVRRTPVKSLRGAPRPRRLSVRPARGNGPATPGPPCRGRPGRPPAEGAAPRGKRGPDFSLLVESEAVTLIFRLAHGPACVAGAGPARSRPSQGSHGSDASPGFRGLARPHSR